jgi:L-2,4-diaminobutyric acid acetyltransferase
VPEDASGMWRLAVESETLDVNSPYAYLLMCTHFASTSIVAEDPNGAGLLGFLAAYRLPDAPDVVFVWQIAVSSARRGAGLGGALLSAVVGRPGCRGVRWMEGTITPSNHRSERLFRSFARSVAAPCERAGSYSAELFPGGEHEPEVRYRIGPLSIDVQ